MLPSNPMKSVAATNVALAQLFSEDVETLGESDDRLFMPLESAESKSHPVQGKGNVNGLVTEKRNAILERGFEACLRNGIFLSLCVASTLVIKERRNGDFVRTLRRFESSADPNGSLVAAHSVVPITRFGIYGPHPFEKVGDVDVITARQ